MGAQDGCLMKRDELKLLMDPVPEARVCLQAELARHPRWADLHHLDGLLHAQQGQYVPAEAAVRRALDVNARYPAARATLAWLLLKNHHADAAVHLIDELGSDDPTGSNGEYQLALVDLAEGRPDEAAGRLRKCLVAEPGRLPWTHRLAVAEWNAGRTDEARRLWREAGTDPVVAPLYEAVGLRRDTDPNDETCGRLLDLVPEHPGMAEIEDYIGRLLARHRLWSDAEAAYRRAYMAEGRLVRYHLRRGFLSDLQGDDQAAIGSYRKAVISDPEWAPARVALAFEYSSQGDARRATEQFEVAARLRPRWADVQYNLGLLYAAAGRSDEANDRFRSALAINPGYAHAQASLAFSSFQLGRMEEARAGFERAVELGIWSSDLFVHLALCHRALGSNDQAIASLQQATTFEPVDEMAWYYLGVIHHERGARRKALGAWKQYLAIAQRGPLYDEIEAHLRSGTDD